MTRVSLIRYGDTMRKSNETKRKAKYDLILEKARLVFCRKGYSNVTMKDIIDECGISRGGIYLYFNSVDEIFKQVVITRERNKTEEIRKQIQLNVNFIELLDTYLLTQKRRLLNMSESLLRAMYEYNFTNTTAEDFELREAQVDGIRNTISDILALGVSQGYVEETTRDIIKDHMMFIIEGLSVYALLGGLTEENVDTQFNQIKEMAIIRK